MWLKIKFQWKKWARRQATVSRVLQFATDVQLLMRNRRQWLCQILRDKKMDNKMHSWIMKRNCFQFQSSCMEFILQWQVIFELRCWTALEILILHSVRKRKIPICSVKNLNNKGLIKRQICARQFHINHPSCVLSVKREEIHCLSNMVHLLLLVLLRPIFAHLCVPREYTCKKGLMFRNLISTRRSIKGQGIFLKPKQVPQNMRYVILFKTQREIKLLEENAIFGGKTNNILV